MANEWLRLWHDMPNDPKWRTISRISGVSIGNVIAIATHHMVSASQNKEKRGVTQCNAEDIATSLDVDVASVDAVFDAMQGRILSGSEFINWEKRQPKREDNSSARVKKYREGGDVVTQCNATKRNVTLDKIREEKEKNTKKENFSEFDEFWKIYPTQRKGNRGKAEAAYRQALARSTAEEILAGLKSYLDSDEVKQGFAKGAAAWLNDDRWANDYSPPSVRTWKPKEITKSNVVTL